MFHRTSPPLGPLPISHNWENERYVFKQNLSKMHWPQETRSKIPNVGIQTHMVKTKRPISPKTHGRLGRGRTTYEIPPLDKYTPKRDLNYHENRSKRQHLHKISVKREDQQSEVSATYKVFQSAYRQIQESCSSHAQEQSNSFFPHFLGLFCLRAFLDFLVGLGRILL